MNSIDPWFLENLICPVDGLSLAWHPECSRLVSASKRVYPVVDGVPIMLPEDVEPTLGGIRASRSRFEDDAPWYLSSVLLSDEEKRGIQQLIRHGSAVDPVAAYLVGATNGLAYVHLIGHLTRYPIPELQFAEGAGKTLLDVGCSWGRWCVAAAMRGYSPIGIDPSLGAVMAARRVAKQLKIQARFLVGDARHLPLRSDCIDAAFSYSVLQHFSISDVHQSVRHIGRVLKPGARSLIQMPTRFGIRCLINQAKRKFRAAKEFEVRYWSIKDLQVLFHDAIGETTIVAECYFGIGWQPSDSELMPAHLRTVIHTSEFIRRLSRTLPRLVSIADSVYVASNKAGG